VTRGVGVEDIGSFSSIWGWDMVVSVVKLRLCVVGEGFYALHWKMLSWLKFGRCMRVLRVLRSAWTVRDARSGFMIGILRVEVYGVLVWGNVRVGSVVMVGSFGGVLSWREDGELIWGCDWVWLVWSFAGYE
jgi:hypothetical protein